ncbi:TonB-dependent receptor [Arenicella xantha]|uniref:Iron complex outermembrane receptor protein n=1 Tax=Arenicella xantha TaxID=644221 RepID=A0A395JKQ6_9GAMM|nr:TonB-dependent receptor [Arenicella xantha]RBP51352.1 iron complex outermembrane receptor protein [Arenicella xantha]
MKKRHVWAPSLTALSVAITAMLGSTNVVAQETKPRASSTLLEEIVVTARKRQESILDVPIAVTALNSEQLDILKVRDIQSLSVGLPNVAFDDVGTSRGVANFSIRGLGINSSIPSIDPTVGTFVDGVYLGTNAGVVFDVFDLESIEVLRGPQGTLFGRNVTGGAVLLNSARPSDSLSGKFKASIEGGGEKPSTYVMGSVGGPVSDTLAAKISVYTNQDDGYFFNQFTQDVHGKKDTVSIRPMVVWTPTDNLSITAIYDYFESEGDGPASQNHINGSGISNEAANFDRDSFDLSIDETGFLDTKSDFFRTTIELDTENGRITNVFGYRESSSQGAVDVDATPISLFHSPNELETEQVSNEIRYAGELNDRTQITTGAYYFKNELQYTEQRRLLGVLAPPGFFALSQDGGGNYSVETLGLFASVDYDLTDQLIFNAGLRYTDEEKSVEIASLSRNVNAPCSVVAGTCPFDFIDEKSWSNLSPKVGLTYNVSDTSMAYTHWTRGFRSGGYNLRNTSIDTVNFGPGPFDEETVDNFEIGFKTKLNNGGRITGAVFYNQIDDMQREINLADPISGVVQVIRNTADATISGLEIDGLFPLSDNLILNASLGYIDPSYDEVRFDLNGDDVINDADRDLDLPRAAKLTYSIGLTLDSEVGSWGSAVSRISYSFRDESAYTDNNLGVLDELAILDAGIDFMSADGRWTFGLYGKNLTDEVKHGGDTQLPTLLGPFPLGGSFAPLAKGRIYGIDVSYNF